MPKQATSRSAPARKVTRAEPTQPKQPPALPRPGGKLAVIIDLLAKKGGASANELVTQTGWQRQSVLGALSRLRTRGFGMQLSADREGAGRVYQLTVRVLRDDAR
jgi:hypothetical protein